METKKVSLKSCSEWSIMYAHTVVYPSTKGVSIILGRRRRRWRWHKLPCIFTHEVRTPSAIQKWTPGVSLCKNCSKWSIMYAHTVVYPSTKGVPIILGRKRRWRWHKLPCFFTHQLHTPSAIQKWTPFPSVQSRTNLAKASWLSSLNMSPSPCTPPTPSNKSDIQNSNQARMMSFCCSLASPSPFLFTSFQEQSLRWNKWKNKQPDKEEFTVHLQQLLYNTYISEMFFTFQWFCWRKTTVKPAMAARQWGPTMRS